MNPPSIFLFAGEPSGDLHGSNLLKALRRALPQHHFWGVGGHLMRGEHLECCLPMEEFAVMGFTDVFLALPKLIRHFYKVRNEILKKNPSCVVFIDYPGFNLRMAKALRKKGYQGKLIHYISPSVWAWGKKRIRHMSETLDLLLTIYPFEAKHFSHTLLPVKYVGNPLQEALANHQYKPDITFPEHLIALFPGSRAGEISRNLPKLLQAASLLKENYPEASFALSCARNELLPLIMQELQKSNVMPTIVPKEYSYELMRKSHSAIAKSGTVTLELALHQCPTVVVYELTTLNRLLAKYLFRIRLPYYCIVNILRGQKIFPELIESGFEPQNVYLQLKSLYEEGEIRRQCIEGCQQVQKLLSEAQASTQAAIAIKEILE